MSAREDELRREHGLWTDDPTHCPKCGATTLRSKYHWSSELNGS